MSALNRARAVILVEDARAVLVTTLKHAKALGVSDSELMQLLNLNHYSLCKLLEEE